MPEISQILGDTVSDGVHLSSGTAHSGMGSVDRHDPISYSSADLQLFTDNFSETNFLGNTQSGKLYRGKIPRTSNQAEDKDVTVKIWFDHGRLMDASIQEESIVKDEKYFLGHPSVNRHLNLPRLIGCCPKDQPMGLVYDINPVDTLHNLILKDSFNWIQRIKVALGFARLLEFLHNHESPYMVRNLDAAHILIDQEFNPILSDFSMLSGGIMGDRVDPSQMYIYVIDGYLDPHFVRSGVWSVMRDVYVYGVILVSMMAKRVVNKESPVGTWVDCWAKEEYHRLIKSSILHRVIKRKKKCSLVHKSLQKEPAYDVNDGYDITKLGMSCLDLGMRNRPTMKAIVQFLQDLRVVQSHSDAIGL